MKLIPHHQDDKAGRREYRSPDGTWRVVRPCRRGGNERPRWAVQERHEDHAGWHCRAAFECRRDALVFLDTTAATPGGESTAVTTMAPKQRETPERSAEPPPPSPRRTPRRPITHYIDETRSEDIRWSIRSYRLVVRPADNVASGMAAWLSCSEADVSRQLIGIWPSATSMCSL